MFRLQVHAAITLYILLCSVQIVLSTSPERHVEIMNESGKKMEVLWLNPKTGKAMSLDDNDSNVIYNGASFQINSFVNHTFVLREVSNETSCGLNVDTGAEGCHIQYMTVSESIGDQIFFVRDDLSIQLVDTKSAAKAEALDSLSFCKDRATEYLGSNLVNQEQIVNDLFACMEDSVKKILEKKNEEITFEKATREKVAGLVENYTCADPNLQTTTAEETRKWTHDGITRDIHVIHQREASKIHVLEHFITPDECKAIENAAALKLHNATVADGKGGSRLSNHRKAMQAGISIPWEKEADGNLIAKVTRRVYDYANYATGYNMDVVGQEDLMSIQYFGRGEQDPNPDQYRPHCDGDCSGLPHKTGGRVATMVMYCTIPESGGSTNFANAAAIVKPELGTAAFFSYMDASTKIMDTGFTSHSGCPVFSGIKRIAVQWMRIGVDRENPWDAFNTLTIKRGSEDS